MISKFDLLIDFSGALWPVGFFVKRNLSYLATSSMYIDSEKVENKKRTVFITKQIIN